MIGRRILGQTPKIGAGRWSGILPDTRGDGPRNRSRAVTCLPARSTNSWRLIACSPAGMARKVHGRRRAPLGSAQHALRARPERHVRLGRHDGRDSP